MESASNVSGPSTSSVTDTRSCTFCPACFGSCDKKILRLILKGRLTVLTMFIFIKKGTLILKSKDITTFRDTLSEVFMSSTLTSGNSYVPPEVDGIFPEFLQKFASFLSIDVCLINRTLDSILTSKDEIIVDFNLEKLLNLTTKTKEAIWHVIVKTFWNPNRTDLHSSHSSECKNWFCIVNGGGVIPIHLDSSAYDSTFTEYLCCIHKIEKSDRMSWYVENYFCEDVCFRIDAYSAFVCRSQTEKIVNPHVVKQKTVDPKNHYARVLRYSSKKNSMHAKVIEFLNNPLMKIDDSTPFIGRLYESKAQTHGFYIVYKENIKPTHENIYAALILLRKVLHRMRIQVIELQVQHVCNELAKLLEIIKYVFQDSDIAVLVHGLKNK